MPLRIRIILVAAASCLALGSCATIQHASDRGAARRVAELLRSGRAEDLRRMSRVPFLIDGEVVPLPQDVAAFWRALAETGWRLEPSLVRSAAAREGWREFGDTMEVRAFFHNYVDERCRILTLHTASGEEAILLLWEGFLSRTILGFRGPR